MTDALLPNGINDGGGDKNYFKKVSFCLSSFHFENKSRTRIPTVMYPAYTVKFNLEK